MKLGEIASRIDGHLERWERDPAINEENDGLRRYYRAGAWTAGSRIRIKYISYQGSFTLTKAQALRYLEWIEAGGIGDHYQMLREAIR